MNTTLHPLAEQYLDRLERAAAHLPRARRRELVGDIEAHLVEALGPDPSDAEVLTVLDRLGEPEEIAAAEAPRPEPGADPRGLQEWAAVILLLLGGFIVGIGWIVGLILLWASRAWTTRDKLIGTLLWPGGLVAPFIYAPSVLISSAEVCSNGVCRGDPSGGFAMFILLGAFVVPFVTAFYLARRARRAR
jgi:hypothetical protein